MITSLLRRLQAQTLPNKTPPIGKIYPFSKMAVAFEPVHYAEVGDIQQGLGLPNVSN